MLAQFQTSEHPFILTPGDNDWTDCHILRPRQVDPMERLTTLREMFYPAGRSLGKRTMPVESQSGDPKFSKFRENLAWTSSNVTFATMHIVGSNNNRGRTPEMDAETDERMAANIAWLKKAFADAKARNSPGLVLMTQANPGFETRWTRSLIDRYFRLFPGVNPPKELPPGSFDDILNAIATEMESYDKPTLFIHGDTHIFHVSKPLVSKKTGRFVDHFTRLEVFGDPDSHWVRVLVDPATPGLFTIRAEIIPENRGGHPADPRDDRFRHDRHDSGRQAVATISTEQMQLVARRDRCNAFAGRWRRLPWHAHNNVATALQVPVDKGFRPNPLDCVHDQVKRNRTGWPLAIIREREIFRTHTDDASFGGQSEG